MLMNVIKKILKILLRLIETAVLAVFILLTVAAVSYRKTGQGIGFLNYENYKTFIISLNNNISTYTMGEMPLADEIKDVEHRKNSSYDNLSHNEKIIYNAMVTRDYQILNNVDLNTEINIPIDDMNFPGLEKCKTYSEIKKLINEELSKINYEAIYRAIHLDYDYLVWWEYDMEWEISEPIINLEKSKLKDSLFIIKLRPAACYTEAGKVSKKHAELAYEAYNRAKDVAKEYKRNAWDEELTNYKNYVVKELEYDDEVAEDVFSSNKTLETVSARNYINAFDGDQNTNAICGGYSVAFQLLCDLENNDSYICYKKNGSMSALGKTIQHTWNIIEKDGKRYLVDVTNSDDGTVGQYEELFLVEIPDETEYTIVTKGGNIYKYKEMDD